VPDIETQDAASGAALSLLEIGRLMTVLQDQSFAATQSIAAALQLKGEDGQPLPEGDQALLKQTRADLALFFDTFPDGTIRAGDDFDVVRDKNDVRMTVRLRCGLPAVSTIIAAQLSEVTTITRTRRVSQSVPTKTVYHG
jgi:hypothetical protein